MNTNEENLQSRNKVRNKYNRLSKYELRNLVFSKFNFESSTTSIWKTIHKSLGTVQGFTIPEKIIHIDMDKKQHLIEGSNEVGETLASSFGEKANHLRNSALEKSRKCPITQLKNTIDLEALPSALSNLENISQDWVREFLQKKSSKAKDLVLLFGNLLGILP